MFCTNSVVKYLCGKMHVRLVSELNLPVSYHAVELNHVGVSRWYVNKLEILCRLITNACIMRLLHLEFPVWNLIPNPTYNTPLLLFTEEEMLIIKKLNPQSTEDDKVVNMLMEEEHKSKLCIYRDYIDSFMRVKKASRKLTF